MTGSGGCSFAAITVLFGRGSLTKSANSSAYDYTSSGILAEFTGLGNIVLPTSTQTYTNISYTSGNVSTTNVTYAGTAGQVTYTFTPVPEPSTFALLGAGAIGLLGWGWRKRKIA